MVWNLLSAFSMSALIVWTVFMIREQSSRDAGQPSGAQEPVCRLHDWSWTEHFGYVCRRCRCKAG